MLRFFEPEVDTRLPVATPSFSPCRYGITVDPRLHEEVSYSQNSDAPAMPMAVVGRRIPSALATVDLVKGRWFPSPEQESNGSRSSSPSSSSSVNSMISNGCISISWPNRDANFSLKSPSDYDKVMNHGTGDRSYSTFVNTVRKEHGERMVDCKTKRRTIDKGKNTGKEALRERKKQKAAVHDGQLRDKFVTLIESASTTPWKMMTSPEIFKVTPMSKSAKIGEKITALQQLVSPFGKTDTSSVLHEAAIYIKTLHEQIRFLSSHYFGSILSCETDQVRNGGKHYHPHHRHQMKLTCFAEVGLCMVPMSPSITNLLNQEPLGKYVNDSLPW